jgi:UDP-N-acetylglucosamine 4-epimerase
MSGYRGVSVTAFQNVVDQLPTRPATWLVTGVAGFIGSNLLEALLRLDQTVIGLDNLSTGHVANLDAVQRLVGPSAWRRFRFIRGDIADLKTCRDACKDVEFILHQAALGSVPRSLEDPINTNRANVTGFLNMLVAARDAKVRRFVYAASSSTYGDEPSLPKREQRIGSPLSPYAVTKLVNELYAEVFARSYGLEVIGLRYFNVFGPRQDPNGAYAAVIPAWIGQLLKGARVVINGDGETSRDFCFVANAVQANLLAATAQSQKAINQVYNVAVGERTSLNQLFAVIAKLVRRERSNVEIQVPQYGQFRQGDVRHSLADISKARHHLGYEPSHRLEAGLDIAVQYYVAQHTISEIA